MELDWLKSKATERKAGARLISPTDMLASSTTILGGSDEDSSGSSGSAEGLSSIRPEFGLYSSRRAVGREPTFALDVSAVRSSES